MVIWQEYFENANIACFHYLVNKKLHWTERIFWLIAILISIGGTYFVVSRTIYDYRTQKPMYRVETDYLDWRTSFPSVVACERTEAGKSSKLKRVVDKFLEGSGYNKSMITDDLRAKLIALSFLRSSDIEGFRTNCGKDKICPTANFSIAMEQIRSKCEDLFTFCKFNNDVFKCCDEFIPIETAVGKCFAINNYSGRYKDGSYLKELKYNIVRAPGMTESQLYVEFKTFRVVIYVVSPREVPHNRNEKAIFRKSHISTLTDGFAYYHRVNVKETLTFDDQKSVPIEARGCRFPHENDLQYFDFYSESHCILECYMMAQYEACGCILHTYPAPVTDHCTMSGILCMHEIPDMCFTCLPDCNSTSVQVVGSTERRAKYAFLGNKTAISFKMDVPAPSLRYIRYTLKSGLTIMDLLKIVVPSDSAAVFLVAIGGAIGFFLGSSFLSIAQLFYYFCLRSLCDYLILKRKQTAKEKEKRLHENFRVARMKLKLDKVEKDIHRGMMEKIEESTLNM